MKGLFDEAADIYRAWAEKNPELPAKVGNYLWRRMVCDTLSDPLRAKGWSLPALALEAERRAFLRTRPPRGAAELSTSPASVQTHRRIRKALAALARANSFRAPPKPCLSGEHAPEGQGGPVNDGPASWLW